MNALFSEVKKHAKDSTSITKLISFDQNELNSDTKSNRLWNACKDTEKTLVIVKTNYDKIIGSYMPIKIEQSDWKSYQNISSFTFYFSDDKLKVMTIKDKFNEKFTSNNWDFFVFGNMYIKNNRNFNDSAFVW